MNGSEAKQRQRNDSCDAPRMALVLSVFVFPGAGQFIQKRWIIGVFYATLFLVGAVFLLITIFVPLLWNLRMLAELAGTDKLIVLRPTPYARIFSLFGFLLAVYAASLLDTVIYNRRRR